MPGFEIIGEDEKKAVNKLFYNFIVDLAKSSRRKITRRKKNGSVGVGFLLVLYS